MENRYVFVCVANNSGSTLIDRYLAECENVACFPPKVDAHHYIYDYMPMKDFGKPSHVVWTEKQDEYDNEANYNWGAIINSFNRTWKKHSRFRDEGRYLVAKSPMFVSMVPLLQKYFPNAIFILSLRNIYACCEGLRRRWKIEIGQAARHFIKIFQLQKKNMDLLGENSSNSVFYLYRELCETPDIVKGRFVEKMSLLHDLDFSKEVSVHNLDGPSVKKSVYSYNNRQIKNLSKEDIEKINCAIYCMNARELIESFGFEVMN